MLLGPGLLPAVSASCRTSSWELPTSTSPIMSTVSAWPSHQNNHTSCSTSWIMDACCHHCIHSRAFCIPKSELVPDVSDGSLSLCVWWLFTGDIKPSNIFLTKQLRAVLGDFDGVREPCKTLTAALPAGTFGYIAPEVVNGQTHFTMACDVYSLGVVAKQLFEEVPMVEEDAQMWQELVDAAMKGSPDDRIKAEDLLSHKFVDTEQPEMRQCLVCYEVCASHNGTECRGPDRHFQCGSCVADYVLSKSRADSDDATSEHKKLARRMGQLQCPMCIAKLAMDDVHRLAGEEVMEKLREAVKRGMEAILAPKMQNEFDERVREIELKYENAKLELGVAERVAREEQYIVEQLVNIKCPSCQAVFADFDGCFALNCHRCGAGICGWCMAVCGQDAHSHVAKCKMNKGHGQYYGSPQQFEKLRNTERKDKIIDYLKTLDPLLQAPVKERVNKLLKDHGFQV